MQRRNAGLVCQGKDRTHGFRLSGADIAVLIIGAAASAIGYYILGEVALFIPYVLAHFFLFCNVFRIRRRPEIIWAFAFLLNCCSWVAIGGVNVFGICASQLLVTLSIVLLEIRRPYYHGILADRLNPNLRDYLEGRV